MLRRTDQLSGEELAEIRALMDAVFGEDFTEDDWGHALGGTHALVHEGSELVAHGSMVPRELLLGDRRLHSGYIEALAVRPDHQRRGLGTAVMAELEELLRRDYDVGALSST